MASHTDTTAVIARCLSCTLLPMPKSSSIPDAFSGLRAHFYEHGSSLLKRLSSTTVAAENNKHHPLCSSSRPQCFCVFCEPAHSYIKGNAALGSSLLYHVKLTTVAAEAHQAPSPCNCIQFVCEPALLPIGRTVANRRLHQGGACIWVGPEGIGPCHQEQVLPAVEQCRSSFPL